MVSNFKCCIWMVLSNDAYVWSEAFQVSESPVCPDKEKNNPLNKGFYGLSVWLFCQFSINLFSVPPNGLISAQISWFYVLQQKTLNMPQNKKVKISLKSILLQHNWHIFFNFFYTIFIILRLEKHQKIPKNWSFT